LIFSENETQLMTIKGGLKPTYTVKFGTGNQAAVLKANETAKYLSIILDPRQSYWDHIEAMTDNSKDLYSRLRGPYIARWLCRVYL